MNKKEYTCKLRISAEGGETQVLDVNPKIVKLTKGFPTGKLLRMTQTNSKGDPRITVIKPYYRKFIGTELNVFAIEVPTR